jgi:hypothetical protein
VERRGNLELLRISPFEKGGLRGILNPSLVSLYEREKLKKHGLLRFAHNDNRSFDVIIPAIPR